MKRLTTLLLASMAFNLLGPGSRAQDRGDLIQILQQQVRSCYILPTEAQGAESVVIELRLEPNGALARKPEVFRGLPDSLTAKAALRAINKCAPFKIPKEFAPLYGNWKVMRIQFNTTR